MVSFLTESEQKRTHALHLWHYRVNYFYFTWTESKLYFFPEDTSILVLKTVYKDYEFNENIYINQEAFSQEQKYSSKLNYCMISFQKEKLKSDYIVNVVSLLLLLMWNNFAVLSVISFFYQYFANRLWNKHHL